MAEFSRRKIDRLHLKVEILDTAHKGTANADRSKMTKQFQGFIRSKQIIETVAFRKARKELRIEQAVRDSHAKLSH